MFAVKFTGLIVITSVSLVSHLSAAFAPATTHAHEKSPQNERTHSTPSICGMLARITLTYIGTRSYSRHNYLFASGVCVCVAGEGVVNVYMSRRFTECCREGLAALTDRNARI